ncbi:MAG TPA: FxSxx-COOH system tetratricopeptide repeat protein [Ktedonobacteraceae bacterium]|nr:FxSxx-COOH system tetratricopeptide repeat protein [Ktedonobacteraceae bacterium]
MSTDNSDLSSFGELLKAFRTRTRLTQQQLAERLGVRRNTIGTWERGDFLPGSKGIVLELARLVCQNEQEACQLLEASLTAPVPQWSVPFPRNPFFTGREAVLDALHSQLGAGQPIALTQSSALHGLGGVGKTQIALEYAYRYALEYRAVFWIEAEQVETVRASFLRLARLLQVPESQQADQQQAITSVQRWLTTHNQWLLIWDNLEAMELLPQFLPPTRQGAVFITTRHQALGTLAYGLELSPMEPAEGITFLLRRAKILDAGASSASLHSLQVRSPTEYAAAEDLVTTLGGLPLALDQASAYLEETGCTISDYLHQYARQQRSFLERRGAFPTEHPQPVFSTLRLVCQQAAQDAPLALELARCCAFLYPDAIPEEIFREGASHLASILGPTVADPIQFDLALAALQTFSLVRRDRETRMLSFHRLVQVILREEMSRPEQQHRLTCLIHALNALFPSPSLEFFMGTWEASERLLPQVMACVNAIGEDCQDLELAEVLQKAAAYLMRRDQFDRAEALYQRALHLFEQGLGPQHPRVGALLDRLADLYRVQGQYTQAASLFRRALSVLEQVLGPEHPEVASPLYGLASIYLLQGQSTQAESLFQHVLHIREQRLGPEHLDVAGTLSSLALLRQEQGKYEQAVVLSERALRIFEQHWGPEHPGLANLLNNLGGLYTEMGYYEQAEPFCKRAAHLFEQAYGPEDSNVGFALDTLATLYCAWGKYEQAEPLYHRALHLFTQAFGPAHRMVSYPLNGLALIRQGQGQSEEAERLFQRALQIREQTLGQDHPGTAQTLHDLASLRKSQGDVRGAVVFAKRASSIRAKKLGEAHPKALATKKLLAQLLSERSDAQAKTTPQQRGAPTSDVYREEHLTGKALLPLPNEAAVSFAPTDPLQGFLDACCDLHPHAWCRSADLWQAYVHWAEEQHERFPLSRGAFIAQLKAHGCRADRTRTARIWRGIALMHTDDDGG